MPIYRTRVDAQESMARRSRNTMGAFLLVVAITMAGGLLWSSRELDGMGARLTAIGLISAWIAFVVYKVQSRYMKLIRSIASSFELDVETDSFTRRMHNFPDITLHRSEVKSVHETRNGLAINSSDYRRKIGIPPELDGYEQLKKWMVENGYVVSRTKPWSLWFSYIAGALFLVVFFGTAATNDPRIVTCGSILSLAYVGYALWLLSKRNANVSSRSRKVRWVYLVMVGIILLKLWFVWTT